jgi:hypothetical protein
MGICSTWIVGRTKNYNFYNFLIKNANDVSLDHNSRPNDPQKMIGPSFGKEVKSNMPGGPRNGPAVTTAVIRLNN